MSDQVAPAPWELKGRSWLFILSGLSKESSLPAGFSAPYEADALASGGEFIGGQGTVQLVSYSESPVGPYDELIYSPGRWKYADGSAGFRITRIYVSSKISTENGRRNWNIPKQVANFNFDSQADGSTTFEVTLPGASEPFFKASIKTLPLISSIPLPFTTTILGGFYTLKQPPIPAGDRPEEVGTTRWASLIPVMKGTAHVASLTPGFPDGKVGDGIAFPAVAPWGVAIVMNSLQLYFGVSSFSDSV